MLAEKHNNSDGTVKVVANIENASDFDVEDAKLLARVASDVLDIDALQDLDVIRTVDLGKIAGRNNLSAELYFDPQKIVPAGEEYALLYLELTSEKEYAAGKSDFVVESAAEKFAAHRSGGGCDAGTSSAVAALVLIVSGIYLTKRRGNSARM